MKLPASLAHGAITCWLAAGISALLLLSGCETPNGGYGGAPSSAATLAGAVHEDRLDTFADIPPDSVALFRGGTRFHAPAGTALDVGDTLVTGGSVIAVLDFPNGSRAYVYPDSRVRVGSLFNEIGKVYIRVKGLFTVQTTFLTAGAEGTEYWVVVQGRDQVRVVVAESVVRLTSTAGAWPERRLQQGEEGQLAGATGLRVAPVDLNEIRRERERVRRIDQVLPPKPAVSPAAVGIGLGILGAGALIFGRDTDRERPKRPKTDGERPRPGAEPSAPPAGSRPSSEARRINRAVPLAPAASAPAPAPNPVR